MLRSYVILALRNLFKNKLYAVINVVGLSTAIACCITAYVNYEFSQSYDRFHENLDQLYAVHSYKTINHNRQNWSIIPMPMGEQMKTELPGIENLTRISPGRGSLRYGDKVFNESFQFVDPALFEMLTFTLAQGNKQPLQEKHNIAISQEVCRKYFGEEAAVGKQVTISLDGTTEFDFVVAAVFHDPPKNSSLQPSIVLPFENLTEMRGFDIADWEYFASATLIQLSPNASLAEIQAKLPGYVQKSNAANPDWEVGGFYLVPFGNIALVRESLRGDPYMAGMNPAAIVGPSVVALLILLMACFNYVNTAIAFATRRLKEIGIRKVVGSIRSQLIIQFLCENLVMCFIALLIGVGLAELFVPAYDALWPNLDLSLSYGENLNLFLFLIGLLCFTGLAAGAYPAFYVSHFKPSSIFRGKQALGGTNRLIRVLLTFQFALSLTAIVGGLVFQQNAEFIKTVDMGFDREQIYVIPVKSGQDFEVLKQKFKSDPNVVRLAGSRNMIGSSWRTMEVQSEQTKTEVQYFRFGENYLNTFGLTLLDGRELDWQKQSDIDDAILVNETLAQAFGWENPLGREIKFLSSDDNRKYRVVGVVRDFNQRILRGLPRGRLLIC